MRDFSRSRVHFPDLEVYCDWSTFFPLKSADVSGEGTRQEPLRTSAWEAINTGRKNGFTRVAKLQQMCSKYHIVRDRCLQHATYICSLFYSITGFTQ